MAFNVTWRHFTVIVCCKNVIFLHLVQITNINGNNSALKLLYTHEEDLALGNYDKREDWKNRIRECQTWTEFTPAGNNA